MNLEKLKYFIDLVHTGSFTKTGEKNHVSQTSISQQIHSLEDYFNTQLIDRSTIPVEPTEAGKLLYEEAIQLWQQFTVLEKRMADHTAGRIRIRVEYTSIVDIHLLTIITKQLQDTGDLILDVEKVQLKQAAENLKKNRFDLAISFDSEFADEPTLETIPLYRGTYAAAVGKEHPLYHQSSITPDKLYQYPIVMLAPESIGKSYYLMIETAKRDGFTPNIVRVVDDVETELFLLQTEALVGFFPENYPLPQQKEIKLIPIDQSHHQYEIVMAYRKDVLQPKIKELIQAVKKKRV